MKKQIVDCPCKSGKAYADCCQPFHQGKLPKDAVTLMRSRYAAYALCLPRYIIDTTHPGNREFDHDSAEWARKISDFSRSAEFKNLHILGFQEKGAFATVTFFAELSQGEKDLSFTEKSYFEKIRGKWLYRSGQLSEGHAPHLITTHQLRLLPLAYYGHPILRKIGDAVESITDDLRRLIEEMIETMDACGGIGLAAPQVHHSLKLFVMRQPIGMANGRLEAGEAKVLINPEVSFPSEERWKAQEGCLSIPSIREEVERPKEITISYTDLEGNRREERVSGWEARVMLHENDHINGILFIDHLSKEERRKIKPFLRALENRIHNGKEL